MKVTCDLAFFFSFFLKERGRSRCFKYQMFVLACGGMPRSRGLDVRRRSTHGTHLGLQEKSLVRRVISGI